MKIGPLSLFTRTSSPRVFGVASWHSRHSLTWQWGLSLSLQPISIKPLFHANRIGHHIFFGVGFGQLLFISATRDNNGWQFQAAMFWCSLQFNQQRPMWYRDLYMRERDRELERDFASQRPPSPPLPDHPTVQ